MPTESINSLGRSKLDVNYVYFVNNNYDNFNVAYQNFMTVQNDQSGYK